ncbi:hypothetical protein [Bacillus ectoiniformans]|uniref:hypothetical protein n=1 Tax=Bacillus ectoiniformans TaxID=1494429 RepID=UPI00195A71FD|nr:hypothetical protein [Bacillus ectoiniformans]
MLWTLIRDLLAAFGILSADTEILSAASAILSAALNILSAIAEHGGRNPAKSEASRSDKQLSASI